MNSKSSYFSFVWVLCRGISCYCLTFFWHRFVVCLNETDLGLFLGRYEWMTHHFIIRPTDLVNSVKFSIANSDLFYRYFRYQSMNINLVNWNYNFSATFRKYCTINKYSSIPKRTEKYFSLWLLAPCDRNCIQFLGYPLWFLINHTIFIWNEHFLL